MAPASAVVEEFLKGGWKVMMIGTGKDIERKFLPEGVEYVPIKAEGIRGRGLKGSKGILSAFVTLFKSATLISRFKPDFVLGMGGYVSGPVLLAAKIVGRRIGIQEQNTVMGFTNRVLTRFSDLVFLGFNIETMKRGWITTGTPVRRKFLDGLAKPSTDWPAGKIKVLVMGGSQGARSLNSMAAETLKEVKEISIVHQTGELDFERMKNIYGANVKLVRFIDNIGGYMGAADLIISRAGGSALAEISCARLPAILIPFPHAAGKHQHSNAEKFREVGAAFVVEDGDIEGLKEALEKLVLSAELRKSMASASSKLARPDAAETIYRYVAGI